MITRRGLGECWRPNVGHGRDRRKDHRSVARQTVGKRVRGTQCTSLVALHELYVAFKTKAEQKMIA